MTDVSTNAAQLVRIYQRRRAAWNAAVRAGTLEVLKQVDAKAVDNLSGSGAPGAYPVPVRTGHLRRSQGFRLTDSTSGLVFNTAVYAAPIHAGRQTIRAAGGGHRQIATVRRPFLDDAAARVDMSMVFQAKVREAL